MQGPGDMRCDVHICTGAVPGSAADRHGNDKGDTQAGARVGVVLGLLQRGHQLLLRFALPRWRQEFRVLVQNLTPHP